MRTLEIEEHILGDGAMTTVFLMDFDKETSLGKIQCEKILQDS